MATSVIKAPEQSGRMLARRYTNATMAQIVADIPKNYFGFVENELVDESKRPEGITSSFYFGIVPKFSLSATMFAIVWSNVDNPHVVDFK